MKQLLIILIIIFCGSYVSYACRCHNASFSEEVAEADQIFIGTVLEKNVKPSAGIEDYHYLFSLSKIFKGEKIDTLTIRTGSGGGDCGMVFEVGKTYIVYSTGNKTSRCRRNSLLDASADIGKLLYGFDDTFSIDIGKSSHSAMTENEAIYFNSELVAQRGHNFNFKNKKIAFFLNNTPINKQQYFERWGGKKVSNNLIILTEEEKQKTNGFDAIVVSWRKQGISKIKTYRSKRLNY